MAALPQLTTHYKEHEWLPWLLMGTKSEWKNCIIFSSETYHYYFCFLSWHIVLICQSSELSCDNQNKYWYYTSTRKLIMMQVLSWIWLNTKKIYCRNLIYFTMCICICIWGWGWSSLSYWGEWTLVPVMTVYIHLS